MTSSSPVEDQTVEPCPFDCGAKITIVSGSNGGIVMHERAAGQIACPLNKCVTDLRTWNRRSSPVSAPVDASDYANRSVRTMELANTVARHLGLNPADEIPFEELTRQLATRPPAPSSGEAPPTRLELDEHHQRDGWMFKRLDGGSVRIRRVVEGVEVVPAHIIPPNEWASVVRELATALTGKDRPATSGENSTAKGTADPASVPQASDGWMITKSDPSAEEVFGSGDEPVVTDLKKLRVAVARALGRIPENDSRELAGQAFGWDRVSTDWGEAFNALRAAAGLEVKRDAHGFLDFIDVARRADSETTPSSEAYENQQADARVQRDALAEQVGMLKADRAALTGGKVWSHDPERGWWALLDPRGHVPTPFDTADEALNAYHASCSADSETTEPQA